MQVTHNPQDWFKPAFYIMYFGASFLISLALFLNPASAQAQDTLTNGLVAYYPFNGNASDESGNGNDARVFNATLTTDRFGKPATCYQFDGKSAYIRAFADSLPRRSKTVSLWFYAEPTT